MFKNSIFKGLVLVFILKVLVCISQAHECRLGHTTSGTAYGERGVKQYALVKHGPDGALFLDPYFLPFIENIENQKILDAGCGAAPWAIYAARNGAYVHGIDIQESMINEGIRAVIKAGLENRVMLEVGSVNKLPYQDSLFDKAISINVGCNLPSTRIDGEASERVGLGVHLTELARVLKEKGRAVITAPASLEVLFTSGKRELSEVIKEIEHIIDQIDAENPNSIVEHLSTLKDVYRATFVNHAGKLKLITDINNLEDGAKIWRKLPGLVVPNIYHSENEYINEAINAGLSIVKIEKPKFNNAIEWIEYNEKTSEEARLGDAYINHNAFMIIELEKP